jgi:hypothetical protein
MRRKIGKNNSNNPILKDLEEKIDNFNNEIGTKKRSARKAINFKKINTMG